MKPNLKLLSLIAGVAISSLAMFAAVTEPGGMWPKSWPKELEHLRTTAKTYFGLGGNRTSQVVYSIPFNTREEFESAWPHLLSLRSKGAPITLQPQLAEFQGKPVTHAGVLVLCPPSHGPVLANGEAAKPSGPPWPDSVKTANGELPEFIVAEGDKWVPYTGQTNNAFRHRARVDLILVVDGQIVDTNRIVFPKDAPLVSGPRHPGMTY